MKAKNFTWQKLTLLSTAKNKKSTFLDQNKFNTKQNQEDKTKMEMMQKNEFYTSLEINNKRSDAVTWVESCYCPVKTRPYHIDEKNKIETKKQQNENNQMLDFKIQKKKDSTMMMYECSQCSCLT